MIGSKRFGIRRFCIILAGIALLSLAQLPYGSKPGMAAAVFPAGFTDSLVASINRPTALAFLPDGRMLVAQQAGSLFLLDPDAAAAPAAVLDIVAFTCSNLDRGLLGIAVDPQFASNRYIYLYYTYNKHGACSLSDATKPNPPMPADAPINRVSRFTMLASSIVDTDSELVLIDNMASPSGMHNGGDLQFGKDGYLYISTGDGACDYESDSGCGRLNDTARGRYHLLGKTLRITATGGIPSDNPYLGADSARCNVTGSTDPGKKCQETFNWGLRNPFRFAFDPNAGGTRFFINDVGHGAWEEIDDGIAGADYGWNAREGHCLAGSRTDCPPPPANMTDPIYDYRNGADRTPECGSITGGAFVPKNAWPAAYNDGYLYSDYVCGTIFLLKPAAAGTYSSTPFATELGVSSAVHLAFGPDGVGQSLYYTSYAERGQIRRIRYIGTGNAAPTASFSVDNSYGAGGTLTVNFDAGKSSDPNLGDKLTYMWDFGDGTKVETSNPKTSHTYTKTGIFMAVLRVKDTEGMVSSGAMSQRIDVGNTPPTLKIAAPLSNKLFHVGEPIMLQATADDAQEGQIKDSALSWEVILHHNAHTHTLLPPTNGNKIMFNAPPPEDVDAAAGSFLTIRLTATDSRGLRSTISQALQPHRVELNLATQPAGLNVVVDGAVVKTPATIVSWEGYQIGITAASQPDSSGRVLQFARWSDSSCSASRSIVTPPSNSTLTAIYEPHASCGTVYLPLAGRGR